MISNKSGGSEQEGNAVLEVCVQDSGAGMTDEQIQNVFTPFNNLSDRGKLGGHGVGLSICKQICLQLGGDIQVSSILNLGSKFTFSMKCIVDSPDLIRDLQTIVERSNESSERSNRQLDRKSVV